MNGRVVHHASFWNQAIFGMLSQTHEKQNITERSQLYCITINASRNITHKQDALKGQKHERLRTR
eukprot:2843063-Amphidinium_carterae.1